MTGATGRLARWTLVFATVAAVLLLVAAVYLLTNSERRLRHIDDRNTADLATIVDNLVQWPTIAQSIAAQNIFRTDTPGRADAKPGSAAAKPGRATAKLPAIKSDVVKASVVLVHPDFGEYTINYKRPAATTAKGSAKPSSAQCPTLTKIDASSERKNPSFNFKGKTDDGQSLVPGLVGQNLAGSVCTANVMFVHPDFGEYTISYNRSPAAVAGSVEPSPAKCPTRAKIDAGSERKNPSFQFAGMTDFDDKDRLVPELVGNDPTGSVCYELNLPLARMVRLEETAPGLRAILIANENGEIATQIGTGSLPVRKMSELSDEGSLYDTVLRSFAKVADKPGRLANAQAPIDTRIGGKIYRVYVRPFALQNSAGSEATNYSAIAIVDRETMVANGPRPPMNWIIVFTLAFALLLAVTPTVKLLLLGPVDAIRPAEVIAVGIGLIVAAAIATTSVGLGARVLFARHDADVRLAVTARWMAHEIGDEIRTITTRRPKCRPKCERTRELASRISVLEAAMPYSLSVPTIRASIGPPDFDQPESAFVVDQRGLPYSTTATRREQAGGRATTDGRDYFERLQRRDFIENETGRIFAGAGLKFDAQRFTISRVMARPDGLMKTVLTVPVVYKSATFAPKQPAALVLAWVSKPLLAPVLPGGVEFLLVDLANPDLLVLAHSVPNRPQIERTRFALDPVGVAALDALAAAPREKCGDPGPSPVSFTARYDGRTRAFAAMRVPCTTWAVMTNIDRDGLDAANAESALWALVDWSALFVLAALLGGVLLAVLALGGVRLKIGSLWPNPQGETGYGVRLRRLLWLDAVGLAATLLAWRFDLPVTIVWLTAILVPIGCAIVLFRPAATDGATSARLTAATERVYYRCCIAAIVGLAVVPIAALMVDSSRERATRTASELVGEETRRLALRSEQILAVARTYYADIRNGAPFDTDRKSWGEPDRMGDFRQTIDPPVSDRPFTAGLRALVAMPAVDQQQDPKPRMTGLAVDDRSWSPTGWSALIVLAAALVALIVIACRRAMIGLFGFGVPLNAVDYPEIPEGLWREFDKRTMIVAAPDHVRKAIERGPDIVTVDLFNPESVAVAAKTLVTNLELVLKNDKLRLAALKVLEGLVAAQTKRNDGSRLVVLTSLSPLERLLHGYDRVGEAAELYSEEEIRLRRRQFSEDREALRWSRLFESFDTYYSQERPNAASGRDLTGYSDQQRKIAETVYDELDFLPLSVLEIGLPAPTDGTESDADENTKSLKDALASDTAKADKLKRQWAEQLSGKVQPDSAQPVLARTPAASPLAVIDYFSALFIEHYQMAWSASSHGERLLLYHLAHGRYVNIERAYQLRPLVRRGLVMLRPEPRLLNHSFAQFIRHAESPETIANWTRSTPKGAWGRAQLPFMLAIALGLGILLVFAIQSGESIASYMPVMIGGGSALLHSLGLIRKSTA